MINIDKELTKSMLLNREHLIRELAKPLISKKRYELKGELKALERLLRERDFLVSISKKRKIQGISLRKGMIICFEEFLTEDSNRLHHSFKKIYIEANNIFRINNKDASKMGTLDDIHPENPCSKWMNQGLIKSHYKRIIGFINENNWWLVLEDETKESFLAIYNDVKDC